MGNNNSIPQIMFLIKLINNRVPTKDLQPIVDPIVDLDRMYKFSKNPSNSPKYLIEM